MVERTFLDELADETLTPIGAVELFYKKYIDVVEAVIAKAGVPGWRRGDVANHVFLTVARRYDEKNGYRFVEGGQAPKSWIIGITSQAVGNDRRERRRELARQASQDALETVPIDDASPSERVARESLFERALASLQETQRQVVDLVLAGLSREEIASALQISVESVSRRYSLAKKRMRKTIEQDSTPSPEASRAPDEAIREEAP